jgi:polyisoprenyl-teichoic acid--peptidoglycan teichoic acid transferase
MNRRSPFAKRFWVVTGTVLCIGVVMTLAGLYQLFRISGQIYEATPAPEPAARQTAPPLLHKAVPETSDQSRRHAVVSETPPANKTPGVRGLTPSQEPIRTQGLGRTQEPVRKPQPFAKQEAATPAPAPAPKKAASDLYLLLGVDSRQGEQARADTIIVASFPNGGSGPVHLMSIPRDTCVLMPGHGYQKINHAMTYGGTALLRQTVERFLGMPVDHAVTVDFDGFRQIVEQIGGLNLTVEKNMNYDDPTDNTHIHLHKGQTLATGKQALDYARFRHDAEADTGRMRRQKEVIRAMIQKGGEPENWANLFKLSGIVGHHVKTDVPPRDWIRMYINYRNLDSSDVRNVEIKGVNKISKVDGLWYFFVDESERGRIRRLLQHIRQGNQ